MESDAVISDAEFRDAWEKWITQGEYPGNELPLIPTRYRSKSLANFKGYEKEVATAKDVIGQGGSVFITGQCGSGKTHLGIGLFREGLKRLLLFPEPRLVSCSRLRSARFVAVPEFFVELKTAMDDHTPENEILSQYSAPDLLMLDDLGVEKGSDWSRQMFCTLIDRRYRDEKQTIITSNLSLGQLSDRIDDRISSRITEMCYIIELKGDKRAELAMARAKQ